MRTQDTCLAFKMSKQGNCLSVQWLGLSASTTRGTDLIPGQGTKILDSSQGGKKKNKKNPCKTEQLKSSKYMLGMKTNVPHFHDIETVLHLNTKHLAVSETLKN